ncbi:MAG: tRNA (adenosine(37)-N6)-threonylcarbamoyltransferase complex dimerization subunit type 1 TsaB [bacterium]
MNLLGIETSSKSFSLSLVSNGKIKDSLVMNDGNHHSHHLVKSLDAFLKKNKFKLKEINKIAVDIGPGSFTGIRIGVTAARALAQMLKKDLIGTTSLKNIASQYKHWDGYIISVVPAIKGEVYWGLFDNRKLIFKQKRKEGLIRVDALYGVLRRYAKIGSNLLFCGIGLGQYKEDLQRVFSKNFGNIEFAEAYPMAEWVVNLALDEIKIKGKKYNWSKVLPNYIKLPQAMRRN